MAEYFVLETESVYIADFLAKGPPYFQMVESSDLLKWVYLNFEFHIFLTTQC